MRILFAGLMALLLVACGGDDARRPDPVDDWNPDSRPLGKTLVYECADYEFIARLGPGEMAVWLEDRYLVLSQVRSASGVKYEEGDTVFWMKGAEASLLLDGQRFSDCQLNPARAPWEDARRRGVNFRAVGNEPGWYLEIHREQHLLFVGNYGMQRLMVDDPGEQRQGNMRSYHAVQAGNELQVEIVDESCTDSMKGDHFPSGVLVVLNGRKYRGCGRDMAYPWR